jgi:tetratricopeptide (TPR) repeat protein/peroxiredoxin
MVGTGRDFYREQRIGFWQLEWEGTPAGEFRVRNWRWLDETRARTLSPVFVDTTAQALGVNPSYSAQLLRGTDYWRTILDGACGIDVYGHNGVSVGDIDDDGFDDIYVCQPAGLPNRLYRNRGDGTFEDITESSGVGVLENSACALFADFDNDGLQDLIVVRVNGPLLFLNQGGGKFRQKLNAFHFANSPQGTFTGAAVADYDRDGWLDIYFCLYSYYQGTDQYRYPTPYYDARNGPPNFMMRNQRDGTFRDATTECGLNQKNDRFSFCCGWSDFNCDGWPDLYVVNDFGRKNLYRNNGDGTFIDVAPQAGVEDTGAGMSVCWFDYDNDSAPDLYVADMWTAAGLRVSTQDVFQRNASEEIRALYRRHAMGNSLFRNAGNGSFQETTESTGVGIGRWSWSSDAWDFDHDGFQDLYVANGMVSGPEREDLNSFFWRQVVANSPQDARPSHDYEQGWNAINEVIRADGTWSGYERNVFYANNRNGTFSPVAGALGLDFVEDGRAFALADFDHDGRLEVFVKNRNAPQVRLLKNVVKDLGPSIAFRLRGTKSNRDAIGATIVLETDSGHQVRAIQAGSGFLSQHSKQVLFGLGESKGPVRATIRWPSGLVQDLRDLPINHRVWVEEGADPSRIEPFKTHESWSAPPRDTKEEMEILPATVEAWLLAPLPAPDFALPDLTGQPRTLAEMKGKPALLHLWAQKSPACIEDLSALKRVHNLWATAGLQLITLNCDDSVNQEGLRAMARERQFSFRILRGSDDITAVYNILYRYLFDRQRDLELPTAFLLNEKGEIAKVYRGPLNPDRVEKDFRGIPQTSAERITKALPFPGVTDSFDFQRNYLSLGSVFFQRGYYDQAEVFFQRALDNDSSSAEALYGLGSVYLQQEKSAEARETFERVVKMRSSYSDTLPSAWNNLGLLATREGDAAEAVEHFEKALQLSPDYLIALENLGNAYRQLKQWEDARKTLEHAVAVGPQDPEANYSLGMAFAQLNDVNRAYEYLQRALKFRPDYPEALNNLGILYLRTQRRDQAVASFKECIRVAPAFDQSYLNLARVYAIEGQTDEARKVLRALLQQHPDNVQGRKALDQLPQ